jgi:hypothetical protein
MYNYYVLVGFYLNINYWLFNILFIWLFNVINEIL